MKQPLHPYPRRVAIYIIALMLMLFVPACKIGSSTPTAKATSTVSPPIFPPPYIHATGKVKAKTQQTSAPHPVDEAALLSEALSSNLLSPSDSLVSIPVSQSQVILQLPPHSFPPNDQLTLIANNFQFRVGDFITVVAVPNNNGTFTAQQIQLQQQIRIASLSQFQDQTIDYQGSATASVTCETTCANQSISFVVGGTNIHFTMSSDTTVTGFGTHPSIAAHQTVEVMVQFNGEAPPHVNKVSKAILSSNSYANITYSYFDPLRCQG